MHRIGLAPAGECTEEILDRVDLRSEQRLPGARHARPEIFAEKYGGTPVRDDEAQMLHLPRGKIVPRHLVQERNHT